MVALGIITIILTVFTLIFYAYLNKHTERDVSFFLSVGIISLVMNLGTNMGGIFALAWLYLAISVAFLALGFAVSVPHTIGFYASIGPWFKKTFTNKSVVGWQILALCPLAGIPMYFVWYKSKHELARICGRSALWGLLLLGILLWAILGVVL